MDYEKKYNEALKRAKEIKSKILSSHLSTESCKAVSEYIDEIIPELRESEDERIRQWLYDLIANNLETTICPFERENVLAYLERQKEPVVDKEGMYYYFEGKFIYCGFPVTTETPYDFAMSQQEKQKEQNPDYAYQQLIKTVEEEANALYPNPYKEGTKEWSNREIEREYFMKGRMDSAIKANPELYHNWPEGKDALTQKQKEQKPVDLHGKIEELCSKYPINKYSVSDKELSAYHQGVHLGATKIAEYLSEQKPAEWSEEDEKMRNNIVKILDTLGFLEYCKSSRDQDVMEERPYYKERSWLKSLRPQKLDVSKLENFDPIDVLNRIKTEWPMAWEKVVGKREWSEKDENKIERLAFLVSVAAEKEMISPEECIDLRRFVKSYHPQSKRLF